MDERTFETLELNALLELAARHVQTPPGKAGMMRLRPSVLLQEITGELELTGECITYLAMKGRFGLAGIEDPEPILARLHIEGTRLEPRQILALERLLLTGKALKTSITNVEHAERFPHLSQHASALPDMKPLLAELQGKILPGGEIDDNASPELKKIRKEKAERRHRIHRTLEAMIHGSPHAVQEEIITFRNGRFVIPIRTDSRGRIPGVMHGLSSSGQTTYIEPMNVINQNNDLVRLQELEEIEGAKILLALSNAIRRNLDAVTTMVGIMTTLDIAQAKALFAEEFNCCHPTMSHDARCLLEDARHLLLEHSLRSSGQQSVPISLELDREHRVLVISGPNAGGKTVAIKTIGLISLMAQMGFHVPAREALLPVFDQVFADIGDHQSIAANLSTFTAHMRNIADIFQKLGSRALVLLDEVGTGTDPDEWAALAIAVVDGFRRRGAVTIASTHYPRLKVWASGTAGVRNASVEFDERSLRPTFRLLLGIAGASAGLEIARRMNLPTEIIAEAGDLIEPDHAQARDYLKRLKESLDEQQTLRTSLEEERSAVAAKYAGLEAEFARKERARAEEFEAVLTRAVDEFTAESERAIRSIEDRAEAARIKKMTQHRASVLRHEAASRSRDTQALSSGGEAVSSDAVSAGADETIKKNDTVRVVSLGREGVVESVQDGEYVVIIGALRYRAERHDLQKVKRDVRTPSGKSPGSLSAGSIDIDAIDDEAVSELNIIGLTADEAVDRVSTFIDRSYFTGLETVRIIHGHGKGILKRAIAGFLASHPQVARSSFAPPEKGGSGATLVELRK